MLDFSIGELAVIAVVGLVVIGPEDMPKVLKAGIKLLRQLRSITDEVRKGVDDLINESGIKDAEREITTIIDMDGNPQRVYDISEFLEDKSGEKPRILTEHDLYDKPRS